MQAQSLTIQEYRQLESQRKRRRRSAQNELEVGIWWDDGKVLAIISDPLSQADRSSRWINGHWDHWRAWPAVAGMYDRTCEDEYCSVPRGRVVYDGKDRRAIIYHGSESPDARLIVIAREFRLPEWTAMRDIHYERLAPEAELDALEFE